MSFNLRNIRELSNDPLTKFTNELAKKLSKFLTQNQIDQLEDKEDIFSDGQDLETVIKYHSINSQKQFDASGTYEYFPPFEPDGTFVTCWIQGNNLGNTIDDISGFANHGALYGDPVLVDGAPFDYGINTQGVLSTAVRFNRLTSPFENQEYITIPHNENLGVAGVTTGISFFIRFKAFDLTSQAGVERRLFEKTDGPTPDNGYQVRFTSTGRLIVI